jgi:hypothetical protein
MAKTPKERYEEYLSTKTQKPQTHEGFVGLLITDIVGKITEKLDSNLLEDYLTQSGLSFVEKGMIEEDVQLIKSEKNEDELAEMLVSAFENPEYMKSFIIGMIYGYVKLCNSFDIEPEESFLKIADVVITDANA